MRQDNLRKLGLAAVILLAPGGFILGATLAARYFAGRSKATADADPEPERERS